MNLNSVQKLQKFYDLREIMNIFKEQVVVTPSCTAVGACHLHIQMSSLNVEDFC